MWMLGIMCYEVRVENGCWYCYEAGMRNKNGKAVKHRERGKDNGRGTNKRDTLKGKGEMMEGKIKSKRNGQEVEC